MSGAKHPANRKRQFTGKPLAALHDESDKGWIWFPEIHAVDTRRRVMLLRNIETTRQVYCECRQIDPNFLNIYAERHHRTPASYLLDIDRMVVMSEWYRDALGIRKTGQLVTFELNKPHFRYWAELRATAQHPDTVVRLATKLGALGALLGLLALIYSLLPAERLSFCVRILILVISLLIFGGITIWACSGVKEKM
jgi:hypothetical protein